MLNNRCDCKVQLFWVLTIAWWYSTIILCIVQWFGVLNNRCDCIAQLFNNNVIIQISILWWMGFWLDKYMRNALQMWVGFVVLSENKGIMPTCLIAVSQSHDWLQPMSCSQMGLIQVLAHVGFFNCHGKWSKLDVVLLSVQFMGYYYAETTPHG